jgi:hypothetical protein
MVGLVHGTPFRGIDREEKFSIRRAAFASFANLPGGNNTQYPRNTTGLSRAVQPILYLILMKLEYPIGKIEN